jgi:uncharacterized membrane protein YoaK (UPF0700 family)
MLKKLGHWAWIGGAALAAIAGMVNSIGFLSYSHQAVTHLTGTTSLLSIAIFEHNSRSAYHLGAVIFAFFLGAALSGFLIQRQTLKLGRRYGVALAIEGMLLGIAAVLMQRHHDAGSYFASAACGLQNAMASTYSGTVLRTTHLTGMVTDIGSSVGHLLRGLDVDVLRLRLCVLVFLGFTAGGIAGAALFQLYSTQALYYPAVFTIVVAIIYTAYAHYHHSKSMS